MHDKVLKRNETKSFHVMQWNYSSTQDGVNLIWQKSKTNDGTMHVFSDKNIGLKNFQRERTQTRMHGLNRCMQSNFTSPLPPLANRKKLASVFVDVKFSPPSLPATEFRFLRLHLHSFIYIKL